MIRDINDTEYHSDVEAYKALTAGRQMKAYVRVFGCQQNEADGETVRGMLLDMGFSLTDDPLDCDAAIIITCAIREHAEMKVLSVLGTFKQQKRVRPWLTVGVVGCMAAEDGTVDRLKRDFHYVSFTLPPNKLYRIPSLMLRSFKEGKRTFEPCETGADIVEGAPTLRSDTRRAWVPIMFGCNNFCSYCIVPYVRGRERSRPSVTVIEECRKLIEDGYREITLLGQNVNSYSSDIGFPELLRRIASIDGDFTVRFMTSHPKDASQELIEVMRELSPKIAPFFHLPLQSGSNAVLKRMNRTYTRERYLSVVDSLRQSIPGIALSTDIIIGFPGETDEDFEDTMDIIRRVGFDMVYSFIYSRREGTVAAKMTDFVDKDAVARRMDTLLTYQAKVSHEKNLPYVGRIERVLVESEMQKDGVRTLTGRTYTNKTVHFTAKHTAVGDFAYVKITEAIAFDLFGEEFIQ